MTQAQKHEPKPPIIWTNVLVFVITTAIAFIGVPWYALTQGIDGTVIIAGILALGYCGMSITAGYHRLWSHRTYQTGTWLKIIYAIGGAFAIQNSALHWSSDHRMHHRHVDDNDRDPYSASRGFWYSHIGWMLREYQRHRYDDYSNVPDLQRDKVVMWQHKHYLPLVLITNFGIPLLLGIWHGDVIGMMLVVGFMRLVLSHHFTFFINSLAHIWGRRPYSDSHSARDNGFLAFLTYGEGYHNFHHEFQFDYRNGIRWWQFDPTKWLIKSLNVLGLASDLRKVAEERIEQAKATRQFNRLKSQLQSKPLPNAEELLKKIQADYEALMTQLSEYAEARKAWLVASKEALTERSQKEFQSLKERYVELQKELERRKEDWLNLYTEYAY